MNLEVIDALRRGVIINAECVCKCGEVMSIKAQKAGGKCYLCSHDQSKPKENPCAASTPEA